MRLNTRRISDPPMPSGTPMRCPRRSSMFGLCPPGVHRMLPLLCEACASAGLEHEEPGARHERRIADDGMAVEAGPDHRRLTHPRASGVRRAIRDDAVRAYV